MAIRRRFEDVPITDKLRLIILIISGLSVVGACTVFVTYQWISGRNSVPRRLQTLSDIIADQSTATVEFSQAPQAAAILGSLRNDRQIVCAAIYTKDGRLFADYRRDGPAFTLPDHPAPDGGAFLGQDYAISQPLLSGGERIGTFYIRTDRSEALRRLRVNLATVGLVLLGAMGACLFLAGRLGGLVTEPVLRLARVVQTVSIRKDYSVRVEARGRDELGRLIDGFNDMLVQIQDRDIQLARARDDLERRVAERTRELQEEIVERRTAEAQLQEKDARLTEAQAIARLGSWEWVPDTNELSWSEEMYHIYGIAPGAFGGRFRDFVGMAFPEDRAGLEAALGEAMHSREPFVHEYRVLRSDGTVLFLHARGKTVPDVMGPHVRVLGTAQDVTDRKLADREIHDLNRELQAKMGELASANRELEGFSYSVSHDLRAPLRAIEGFSRMLEEDCGDRIDAEGQRYIEVIRENTRRMGRLIDDLLDFSRLGRKTITTSAIDMAALAREVFTELREQCPKRELELRLTDLPAGQADPAMMRQVLVNLFSNAIKYSRGKSPAVIELGVREEDGKTVYFVRDNGIGFDMKYAHKLFGVFQRLHAPTEFEGTGVGLALVQRIVERHGGRVWAEAVVGEGATFSFSLPAPAEAAVPR